jgi:hypothetical protein
MEFRIGIAPSCIGRMDTTIATERRTAVLPPPAEAGGFLRCHFYNDYL